MVSTESSPLSFGVQKPGQQVRPVNVHHSRSQDAANYRAVICSLRTTRTARLFHKGDVTISRFEAICFHKLTLSLIMKSFNLPRIWLEWAWCGWWKMVQRRSSSKKGPTKMVKWRGPKRFKWKMVKWRCLNGFVDRRMEVRITPRDDSRRFQFEYFWGTLRASQKITWANMLAEDQFRRD